MYKCGHSTRTETHCQLHIKSNGNMCVGPSSDTGSEDHIEESCPTCMQRKVKKESIKPKPLDELAIVVPKSTGFAALPEDPNCGNPKTSETRKNSCDAM